MHLARSATKAVRDGDEDKEQHEAYSYGTMEPYQQAHSKIIGASRACVAQEGEWMGDLPWMSQQAHMASDRGIGNQLFERSC